MRERSIILRLLTRKLWALRMLAKHLGLLGKHRSRTAWPDECRDTARMAVGVVLSPSSHPIQKAYAATLLDIFIPRWRGVVPETVLGPVVDRISVEVRRWRTAVLERDGNACQACGSTKTLHAHHIVRWVDAPSLRLVVPNGVTLCRPCHREAHA